MRWVFNSILALMAALVLIPALALTASIAWVGYRDNSSWHQKIAVEMETPQGVTSGSAVTSVHWKKNFFSGGWGGAPMHLDSRGEAVLVDLGDVVEPRYLFALLKGAGTAEYIGSVAAASISGQKGRVISNDLFREIADKRGRAAGLIEVPAYQYPLLVTFDDITKPETVRKVDPADLAATFGEGYALKSVTLEITDEPVTQRRVERVLGWLESVGRERATLKPYPKGITSDQLEDPGIQLLAPGAFSTELYK